MVKMSEEIEERERRPMVTVLLANAVLAIGVLFFHWEVFTVVSIYWAETVIVGFYFVLKMIFAPRSRIALKKKLSVLSVFSFFFSVAVSMHGIFVVCFFL